MDAGKIPGLCGGTPQPMTVLGAGCIQGSLGLLDAWARFYSRKVHAASGHAGEGTISNLILPLHLPLAYSNMDLHVVQEMQVVGLTSPWHGSGIQLFGNYHQMQV